MSPMRVNTRKRGKVPRVYDSNDFRSIVDGPPPIADSADSPIRFRAAAFAL
jgi:hypothetical protein